MIMTTCFHGDVNIKRIGLKILNHQDNYEKMNHTYEDERILDWDTPFALKCERDLGKII